MKMTLEMNFGKLYSLCSILWPSKGRALYLYLYLYLYFDFVYDATGAVVELVVVG